VDQMTGRCPKCEKMVGNVRGEHVSIQSGGTSWHGISYLCPFCSSILGVEIDPIALKSDIVSELLDKLSRK
jgi:hypothetical protein